MIIEIKSDVGKIEKGVANMSRLIIWVLRFEIHSDFLSASMTHCKIGVNLGCTRCEKSSFISISLLCRTIYIKIVLNAISLATF